VINCRALPGVGPEMVAKNPVVYHIPKMVQRGWGIGIWLDVPGVDWDEVESLLRDAYEISAAKARKKR